MAQLSSNWKKLQARLQVEAGSSSSKRKAQESPFDVGARKRATTNRGIPKHTKTTIGTQRKANQRPMGSVHSSPAYQKTDHGVSPSLSLWASNHDISSEAIAEAYGLGIKGNSMILASDKDRVNHGLSEGIDIGKYIAIDCEMVGVGPGGHESALARVSIVDFHGKQVYDSYVIPREKVIDWRTAVSGISPKEMRFGRDFHEVQTVVADILKDRVIVGHDVKHDLEALKLKHAPRDIRDTARHDTFKKHGNGRKPALRILAKQLLGVDIQSGAHSSLEDARVTMLLFRKHKSEFDVNHANHYAPRITIKADPKAKKPKKKGK